MKIVVAFIKSKGKSTDEIKKIIQDAGLQLHDIKSIYVARSTKLE